MSIETQAILARHVSADEIANLLALTIAGKISVRNMHRPEYTILEFQAGDGTWSAFNLFLDSSVAEDYADTYQGPSTFITAEYSPRNFELIRLITAAVGGFARKTSAEPWVVPVADRPQY